MKVHPILLATILLSSVCGFAEPQTEQVSGTVLYSQPYNFFILQTPERALRVSSVLGDPALKPGDTVSVTGTPAKREGRDSLEVATYTRLGEGATLPDPVELSPEKLAEMLAAPEADRLYGLRVRLRARLLSVDRHTWGDNELVLDTGNFPVSLWLYGELPESLAEANGLSPVLETVGILTFERRPWNNAIEYAWIRVPEAADIAILPDPDFQRRKLLAGLSRFAGYLPWLLIPIIIFLAVRLVRTRNERRRLEAVIAERRRLAGDLHDTIAQHLSVAKMYLESLLPADGSPAKEELKPAELARDILIQAKQEIRETIWNLHADSLMAKTPREALESLAVRVSQTGVAQVETQFLHAPEKLPERIFLNLLCIVQEAITNAVKHGQATRIRIAVETNAVAVINNGKSFNPAAVLGAEAGHFGLTSMRERARRSGMTIKFKSTPHTTSVRLEIKP